MKILLTGPSGMLGNAFVAKLVDHQVIQAARSKLDVRDPASVGALVRESAPDIVINCAAHTDVEAAEHDPDPCFAANALLPGLLADACRHAGLTLVHFSSTGCYGSGKQAPYTEADEPVPTTVHHKAKIVGERRIRESGCAHLILRTGWLFGGDNLRQNNFVWRRIVEARTRPSMMSDAVQRGNPTFIDDVVRQTMLLIAVGIFGTYNVTSAGSASRFDYVARIIKAAGLSCDVQPGPAFRRLAQVSSNEVGQNYFLGLLGLDVMPLWEEALDRYVSTLCKHPS